MKARRTAAIYARISQDREGDGLGVRRQLEDCRAEADRRGWTVSAEYVDDDVSAYSGTRRPEYARLLDDIEARHIDAVIVWHIDRLHRRPLELEQFVQTCTRAGLADVVTLHGDFNLGSGDGLLVARLLSAVAANESDAKSRRGRRKNQERAEAGQPHGGGTRSFGFNDDRLTHRPDEAAVVRALTERAIAGESLTSLVRWLVDQNVATVRGGAWRTPTVRGLLLSPRIYGVRTHRGQPLGRGSWKPIITAAQGESLRAMLTAPERRTNRTARRYLLSGMCRCSRCGTVMYSVARNGVRRYLCRSGPDFGGCGRMAITADATERIITEAVLVRLDTPAMHDAMAGRARETATAAALTDQIDQDTQQLSELSTMWANRAIDAAAWIAARDIIEARRMASRRRLTQLAGAQAIDGYVGNGNLLRQQWATLNLSRQVAIVKAIVGHVQISPAIPGTRTVSVDRITPIWRL